MCFVFNINMVTFEGPPAMLNKRDQKVNSSTTTSSPIELLVNSVSLFKRNFTVLRYLLIQMRAQAAQTHADSCQK